MGEAQAKDHTEQDGYPKAEPFKSYFVIWQFDIFYIIIMNSPFPN